MLLDVLNVWRHAAGIGVESTGHCHPKVVKAIQEQAASLIHTQQNIFTATTPMVRPF
jgi:4-aminobutyrate aminotransferase